MIMRNVLRRLAVAAGCFFTATVSLADDSFVIEELFSCPRDMGRVALACA
jgi:hypothetical protein